MQWLLEIIASWFSPTPPVVPTPPTVPVDSRVSEILRIHNANRTSPLTIAPELMTAAQVHADWMARFSRMSHRGINGSSASQRIKDAGYNWTAYGENVAHSQATPESVMLVWMRSPGHRRNIKNSAFADIGIGVGKSGSGRLYWCCVFGSRRPSLASIMWDEVECCPVFTGEE